MKKNHVVAGLIGAVLLAGSTLSIAAASTSKDWNSSKSGSEEVSSDYLYSLSQGDIWAEFQSLPVVLDTASTIILPFDTATATIQHDDDAAVFDDDSDNDAAFDDDSDDDAAFDHDSDDDAAFDHDFGDDESLDNSDD